MISESKEKEKIKFIQATIRKLVAYLAERKEEEDSTIG